MKTKAVNLIVFVLFLVSGFTFGQTNKVSISANISDKNSGKISVSELVGQEIKVSDSKYTVESFTVKIENDLGKTVLNAQGPFINKEISNNIRTISNGTSFSVTSIIASDSFGNTIKLSDMNFTIQN